jgi:hypothetical protein
MTTHFLERVQERIGNVDGEQLRAGILWAIENERRDLVRFVCRADRNNRRFFEFAVPDGRTFAVLVDMRRMAPVTVFTREMMEQFRAKKLAERPRHTRRNRRSR